MTIQKTRSSCRKFAIGILIIKEYWSLICAEAHFWPLCWIRFKKSLQSYELCMFLFPVLTNSSCRYRSVSFIDLFSLSKARACCWTLTSFTRVESSSCSRDLRFFTSAFAFSNWVLRPALSTARSEARCWSSASMDVDEVIPHRIRSLNEMATFPILN